MKLPRSAAAFSLVEVTLAIGVAAFGLISVFGLLPVGLTSNQAAIEQTAANGVLSAVIADLRATPPTAPRGLAATSVQFSVPIPANPVSTSPAVATLYLTSDGQSSAVGSARHRVTITFLPNGSGPKTATFLKAKVSWPASVDPATRTPTGFVETFAALDRN